MRVPRGAFDAAALNLDRPCTLLTPNDAADVSGQPFYRTMATNLVEETHIRCAQGVGGFGLHGMVELDIVMPEEGETPDEIFSRLCRPLTAQASSSPPPAPEPAPPAPGAQEAGAPAPAPPPQPQQIAGEHCVQGSGGVAFLLADRVVLARVRLGAGEIDREGSRRLAILVGARLPQN